MIKIDPQTIQIPQLHRILLAAVAPRPIAFASTIDSDGNPNLSPFSFYNVFSVNPPLLIFSPARRGKDNTNKHTFDNIKQHAEVVINSVSFSMIEQVSLSSGDYKKGVDEFIKAGFTKQKSEKVKPFRVAESSVQFECKVNEVIETGHLGGAGNLIICEILLIHINENIYDKSGNINQDKIDLVGRMGGDLYSRTSGNSIFTVKKPGVKPGIGFDVLPADFLNSNILTGNDLAKLACLDEYPSQKLIYKLLNRISIIEELNKISGNKDLLHLFAKKLIEKDEILEAFAVLLYKTNI